MVIPSFTFAKMPKIYFGPGKANELPKLVHEIGNRVLIISGASSLKSSGKWDVLVSSVKDASIHYFDFPIKGEPSPDSVDRAVSEFNAKNIDVVLAIGGGSVIDGGKAISAMLPHHDSISDYLEDVGTKEHDGSKVPFIAVPTTSGTGSEATKNAVLSRVGPDGFKKSLRHDNLVPDIAIIDPELIVTCPKDITAACGMDAFSQLLESYVSTKASPITDALALSGLKSTKDNLILACGEGSDNVHVRAAMAYAALMSGITLANAGLGIIHGMASPIGGYFNIPHGVVCGTLLGAATKVNIEGLRKSSDMESLKKYAEVGAILTGCDKKDLDLCCNLLIEKLDEWTETLRLPPLSQYGIRESHLDKIIEDAGNKQNPVQLSRSEMRDLLLMRM